MHIKNEGFFETLASTTIKHLILLDPIAISVKRSIFQVGNNVVAPYKSAIARFFHLDIPRIKLILEKNYFRSPIVAWHVK